MRWREAHQEAMIAAAGAHVDGELDAFNRIDVFRAMHDAGLKLMFKALADSAALYMPPRLGGRPGAIVNSAHPLALQRYSAAHEFGHHVLGHRAPDVVRDPEPRSAGQQPSPNEKVAEAFAAWFLMPPEAIEVAIERLGLDELRKPKDAYALALRLGTSYTATCVHLPSTRLLSELTAKDWADLALKTVKQELTPDPPLGGWRADVWELVEGDLDATLVMRPGDRVVIGIPGASEVDALPDGAVLGVEPAVDLFEHRDRLRVDLPPEMPGGPKELVLSGGDRQLLFTFTVERPRHGLYIPELEPQ